MATCPACSRPNAEGARFCSHCGGALVSDVDATVVSSGADPASVDSPVSASGSAARFPPGAVLAGRYRMVALLGRGGMGEVYRADDLKLGQSVALKFLPQGLERDAQRLARFLDEVRTARQVTHPNVCRVYDIGEIDGQHFLSMEYVDGEDLESLLLRIGRLPQERAVEVARQICAGLAAAHERGILHRDLKPANVMLDGRGQVRLMDFGLAGLAEAMGEEDARAGTPAYMAPEQFTGGSASQRSDVYSLGLVLYELFTGHRVFDAKTLPEIQTQHQTTAPSRPSTHVEALDPSVERAVMRCLEKDPADRPDSVLAVSAALPGGDPLAAALAAGETPSPEMVAAAGRRDAWPLALALGLALAGFALFFGITRWVGTQTTLHLFPLEKRPEVLIDRAQEFLAEAGYVEPAYADPVDHAWGMLVWNEVLSQVAAADSSSTRWEGLKDRPDVASFWYRQSPGQLVPSPQMVPIFVRGPVSLVDPLAATPGEVSMVLDLAGRLRRFQVVPKRYSTREPAAVDWAPLFAMAELDPERFQEVPPRYQRYFAPDRRRAWLGTRAEQPELEVRVEAGSFEGRPVLFNVATPASLESLAEDPTPLRATLSEVLEGSVTPIAILVVILFAVRFSRGQLSRGRADTRGAGRLGVFLFLLFLLSNGLRSHTLFGPNWANEIWPLFAGGCFFGVIGWGMYCAAEPIGRKVWPSIFVSSSRLLSAPTLRWRDPLVGRSVLVGLLAGAAIFAWRAAAWRLWNVLQADAPLWPAGYNLDLLLGQRHTLGWILDANMAIGFAFLQVVALVAVRSVLKRPWPTMVVTVFVWTILFGLGSFEWFVFFLVANVGTLVLLLRGGVLALGVMHVVLSWGWIARSADLGAWYGKPALTALVVVGLLALYGAWAATGGENLPRRQAKA